MQNTPIIIPLKALAFAASILFCAAAGAQILSSDVSYEALVHSSTAEPIREVFLLQPDIFDEILLPESAGAEGWGPFDAREVPCASEPVPCAETIYAGLSANLWFCDVAPDDRSDERLLTRADLWKFDKSQEFSELPPGGWLLLAPEPDSPAPAPRPAMQFADSQENGAWEFGSTESAAALIGPISAGMLMFRRRD